MFYASKYLWKYVSRVLDINNKLTKTIVSFFKRIDLYSDYRDDVIKK
ncbi:conserved hypothetical protein [delta proteobacterium NaphS2]|nr:conserved hypothetical protein [delta proteobacterium NaphS2]